MAAAIGCSLTGAATVVDGGALWMLAETGSRWRAATSEKNRAHKRSTFLTSFSKRDYNHTIETCFDGVILFTVTHRKEFKMSSRLLVSRTIGLCMMLVLTMSVPGENPIEALQKAPASPGVCGRVARVARP